MEKVMLEETQAPTDLTVIQAPQKIYFPTAAGCEVKKHNVINLGKMNIIQVIQELMSSAQIKMTSLVSPTDSSITVKEFNFAAPGMPELTLSLLMVGMLKHLTQPGQITDQAEFATPLFTVNNKLITQVYRRRGYK
jgi:hypothetical protein